MVFKALTCVNFLAARGTMQGLRGKVRRSGRPERVLASHRSNDAAATSRHFHWPEYRDRRMSRKRAHMLQYLGRLLTRCPEGVPARYLDKAGIQPVWKQAVLVAIDPLGLVFERAEQQERIVECLPWQRLEPSRFGDTRIPHNVLTGVKRRDKIPFRVASWRNPHRLSSLSPIVSRIIRHLHRNNGA